MGPILVDIGPKILQIDTAQYYSYGLIREKACNPW